MNLKFNIKKKFIKLRSIIQLNKNEIFFLNHIKKKKSTKKKVANIFVNMIADYYHLIYLHFLINEKKIDPNSIVAVWPYNIYVSNPKENKLISIWRFKFFYYFEKRKWKKLYSSLGIKNFEDLESNNLFINIFFFCKAFYTVNTDSFSSIKKILKFTYKKIRIGDLVVDTYIRFRHVPLLTRKDFFFKFILFKSFIIIYKLKKIFYRNKISKHFLSYVSYVQNGIPARFSLQKKIETISLYSNTSYNKKLSINDCTHIENLKYFKHNFAKIKNKSKALKYSNTILKNKFLGKNNHAMPYLKKSPYGIKVKKLIYNKSFKGVLFLHDFFDSTTIYRPFVFEGYYEWVIYTLDLIEKYNLNIAVKPHPNSLKENQTLYDELKLKYPSIVWVDENVSNSQLFSKINFGISLHGSVLYELAYHGIIPISGGSKHHSIEYDFVFTAKNKNHYKNLILNNKKLK